VILAVTVQVIGTLSGLSVARPLRLRT
jgi:hypothetical protein